MRKPIPTPQHHQKIAHVQRTGDHSFHLHQAISRKKIVITDFRPLIIFGLMLGLSAWGIWKYWNYHSGKKAAQNYEQGVKDLSEGNFSEAEKKLEESIRNGNDATDPLIKLGVSKYNQKDYAGAIEAYQKVLEKDPLNATAGNSLGNVYRDQKDFKKAQEQYEKTIQANPSFAPSYANLSIMLLDLGQKKEAQEIVRQGLERIPGSIELKNIETLFSPEE